MQVALSASECRPYRGAYVIPLTLMNPVTGAQADLEGVVDTGFDGSVMVESEAYDRLGFRVVEKPSDRFPVYRTLAGSAVFRSSPGRARVAGREVEAEVVTPLLGPGKNIVGRRLLREFTTVLFGAERTCIGVAHSGPAEAKRGP